jgi:hypothetical protein
MPRYYFNLRDGGGGVTDPEGTDLPGRAAAKAYAAQVATELMGRAEVKRRHWQLDVSDGAGKVLFSVPFAAVDTTIDHLAPTTRSLIEQLCRNRRELGEAVFEARLAALKSKATIARSKGKPYLAAHLGRQI